MEFVLIPVFASLLVVAAIIVGYRYEKRQWNNGICAASGLPWVRFDIDSQGGRGYTDGQGNYCWISWPVDK